MKKTKIVCTLGPATDDPNVLEQIMKLGMDVARMNFSHGDHAEHKRRFDAVKELRERMRLPVAIMLDNKGPEVRIKQFAKGSAVLKEGKPFILTGEDVAGDETKVSVTFSDFYKEVQKGSVILIDDGLIRLTVQKVVGKEIHCMVENGGELKNNKSINIPGVDLPLPSLTEKDISDIKFGIENGMDFIAASFVRSADDVLNIRNALEENGGATVKIISKIESRSGVERIDEIIELSDGIMVARGDLGVEIPPEEVPIVQKHIIRQCNVAGKPVITATQMLDSMIRNPRATRAEVGDVANAIFDGSDAVMLSGETAAGKYPVEAVETMIRIAETAEASLDVDAHYNRDFTGEETVTNIIGYASCSTAESLHAKAIITPTSSGYTARMISKFRPHARIVAVMDKPYVQRQLSLTWGVESILFDECENFECILHESFVMATERGIVEEGDLVVITAGLPIYVSGTTNSIRVETVGHYVLRGTGIGKRTVRGRIRIVKRGECVEIQPGEIIATDFLEECVLDQVDKAAGLITTQKGLGSRCVVAAIKANIPAIVGLPEIDSFPNGTWVEVDPHRHMVYRISHQLSDEET